jgi:acyl carrier protein
MTDSLTVEECESLLRGFDDVADAAVVRTAWRGRDLRIGAVAATGFCDVVGIRDAVRERCGDGSGLDLLALVDRIDRDAAGRVAFDDPAGIERAVLSTASLESTETPTEAALARMWCEALKRDFVGAGDDFLDLGGDSLAITDLLLRVRQEWGVPIEYHEFADVTELRQLARFLDAARAVA